MRTETNGFKCSWYGSQKSFMLVNVGKAIIYHPYFDGVYGPVYIYIHTPSKYSKFGDGGSFCFTNITKSVFQHKLKCCKCLSCSVARTRTTSFQMLLASYRWDLELRCLAEVAVFPRGKTFRQTREPSQTWQMWDGKSRTGHVFPKSFGFHC